MEEWRLIDSGDLDPLMAQNFWEALAVAVDRGLSPNTVHLCRPSSYAVIVGYNQNLEKDVDLEFCRQNGIPVYRRIQGGGAMYHGPGELWYQFAFKHTSAIPKDLRQAFERILSATSIYVYKKLGLNVRYKPINDVVVFPSQKKIGACAAATVGDTWLFGGNLIMDLDFDRMVRIVKVPDEKFRDKLAKSIREWVTTLRLELGEVPPLSKLKELLNIVDQILSLKPKNIEEEARNPLRLKLDELVLSVLGLNKNDVNELYKGLLELVEYRMIRSNKE